MHANQCNTWKLKFHGPTFPQLGMASALETLCGQSYGAKQYHMLGIYLQRSWIILFACAVMLAYVCGPSPSRCTSRRGART
jgi:Na+-driven multidrug efflux pump